MLVSSISKLVIELVLINELITKCEGKWNEGSLHTIDNWIIFKNYILYQYFELSPPNYIVGKYSKYLLHVEKVVVLSHDLTMFHYIFVTSNNCKYEN